MSQTLSSRDIGSRFPADGPLPVQAEIVELPSHPIGDRADSISRPAPIHVSIVVPYFNPGDRLRPTVEQVLRALTASGETFEVITVSDGSTDGSPSTLGGLPEHLVRQISYPANVGKGYALRTGFSMARGRYVGFIDSDGDISPDLLTAFVAMIGSEEADFVVGSKRHPDAALHNSNLRRVYSWGYQTLIRVLFSLDVKDTQVGLKLMDRRVLDEILPLLREDRFALDVELLVLAQRHGYTRIVEAPVCIEERSGSTVSYRTVRELLADTLSMFWRSSVRRCHAAQLIPVPALAQRVEPVESPAVA